MSGFPDLTSGSRPVGVVSFAQYDNVRREDNRNEVEMLMPVVAEVFGNIGITKDDVGFICSGSTDYLVGGPFSFVAALDAVGVWPPRAESHVEMDGAWALYEAWMLLQEGEIDAALVYAFGRSSMGDLSEILSVQLDPYYLAPLWPDPTSLAALQAQAMIDKGLATEADFAEQLDTSRGHLLEIFLDHLAFDHRRAGMHLYAARPQRPERALREHRNRLGPDGSRVSTECAAGGNGIEDRHDALGGWTCVHWYSVSVRRGCGASGLIPFALVGMSARLPGTRSAPRSRTGQLTDCPDPSSTAMAIAGMAASAAVTVRGSNRCMEY